MTPARGTARIEYGQQRRVIAQRFGCAQKGGDVAGNEAAWIGDLPLRIRGADQIHATRRRRRQQAQQRATDDAGTEQGNRSVAGARNQKSAAHSCTHLAPVRAGGCTFESRAEIGAQIRAILDADRDAQQCIR